MNFKNTDIYLNLFLQEPIEYNGLLIKQPRLIDIFEFGVDKYNNMLTPFILTFSWFDFTKEQISKMNLFEDVILKDQGLLSILATALLYFCNPTDIIKRNNNLELRFADERIVVVNKDNFDELSNIVIKISATKKITVEKPPENMSERQRDIWYKLQEGRKRSAEKDILYIHDILNICEFGGKYHISVNELKEWSLWRIMNCYRSIINIKQYDDNLQICLVSGDGKAISGDNHWYHKMMVRE